MEMQCPLHFRTSRWLYTFTTFPNYLYILFRVCWTQMKRPTESIERAKQRKKNSKSQRNRAQHNTKPNPNVSLLFAIQIMDNDFCRQLTNRSEPAPSERGIRIKSRKKGKISWHETNEVGLRFTERTEKKTTKWNSVANMANRKW